MSFIFGIYHSKIFLKTVLDVLYHFCQLSATLLQETNFSAAVPFYCKSINNVVRADISGTREKLNKHLSVYIERYVFTFQAISTMTVKKKSATALLSVRLGRSRNAHKVQNFHVVWLDSNIDVVNSAYCRNSIMRLRQVVNTINIFDQVDECIDSIDRNKEDKTFMIVSGTFGQTTVPAVHDKPQVDTIQLYGLKWQVCSPILNLSGLLMRWTIPSCIRRF